MTDREKLLEELLSASKQMALDESWPVTEDELVKYHSSSFDFGFACGALWCKDHISEEPANEDLEKAAEKSSYCEYLEEVLSDDEKEVLRARLRNNFIAGANAVLEEINNKINQSFLEDFEGMDEHDREIAQGAIAMVNIWIQQLKG